MSVFFVASVVSIFVDPISQWIALGFCFGPVLHNLSSGRENLRRLRRSISQGVDTQNLPQLNQSRLNHWKVLNAKPTNGIMALSRTKQQLAVMYCEFGGDECWLHLDVFSDQIFDLEQFLIEEE